MATILKGKHKGKEVRIRQCCNDWFSVDGLPPQESIIRPTNIKLTVAEMVHLQAAEGNTGILFALFDLWEDGTFKRRYRARG
jgi:uncharacterized protein (DUF1810 family)